MSETMDEVLERLRGTGVELRGTVMPNHLPMATEALCAMGQEAHAVPWAEAGRDRLLPLPPPLTPIAPARWQEALGDPARLHDWLRFFRGALEAQGPFEAVAAWVPRLLPGILAGGGHALIRLGHAVRSLEARDTPLRREELALSLAYWASDLRVLPGTPRLDGALDFDAAALAIPRVLTPLTRVGVPRELVHRAGGSPGFAPAVEAAAAPPGAREALLSLCALGARLYRAHAATQPLVFLHALTLPAALLLVLPHLAEADQRPAVGAAWQASAAWIATFDDGAPNPPPPEAPPPSPASIVSRGVATGDAHAFKLTEACTRLHALRPAGDFLAVADDFCARVEAAAHWTPAERRRAGMRFD